jgi:hypothetical protein
VNRFDHERLADRSIISHSVATPVSLQRQASPCRRGRQRLGQSARLSLLLLERECQQSELCVASGERFNTLNKPAKPSGRRQGMRSTGSLARSTLLLFFDSLMRRPGDTAPTFLASGSGECRLTIFGVAGGLGGCGGVSSRAFVTSITGSAATGRSTYATSSLSALVNVFCAKPIPTVVCSGAATTFGGGVGVLALIATVTPRPIKQKTASDPVLITANPAWSEYAN